jgi:hypothetical protein
MGRPDHAYIFCHGFLRKNSLCSAILGLLRLNFLSAASGKTLPRCALTRVSPQPLIIITVSGYLFSWFF